MGGTSESGATGKKDETGIDWISTLSRSSGLSRFSRQSRSSRALQARRQADSYRRGTREPIPQRIS